MRTHAERVLTHPQYKCRVFRNKQYLRHKKIMSYQIYLLLMLVISITNAAPANKKLDSSKITSMFKDTNEINEDLKTASSSYSHQYADWGGNSPGAYGFSVTGIGVIDDKLTPAYKRFDGYDNSLNSNGYSGNNNLGYNDVAYGGYKGYSGNIPSSYNSNKFGPGDLNQNGFIPSGFGPGGYASGGYGTSGYGANGYGASGYGASGYGASGYGPSGYEYNSSGYSGAGGYTGGNGGYGGFGGNGGLASYSGYNNPYYQGAGHLGYGYYNKKAGYGNIYSSGVTPSLVTGFRGYTR